MGVKRENEVAQKHRKQSSFAPHVRFVRMYCGTQTSKTRNDNSSNNSNAVAATATQRRQGDGLATLSFLHFPKEIVWIQKIDNKHLLYQCSTHSSVFDHLKPTTRVDAAHVFKE